MSLSDVSGSGPDALVQAYIELRPTLLRAFTARLRSAAAAEDVVQELYLRICNADPLRPIAEPRAWMFQAASNIMIDMRRRSDRSGARDAAWLREGEVASLPPAEGGVAARQALAKAMAAVDAMPPRMAEAFRLHRLQGLTQAETAQRMGVSVKAVEKHLAGALKRLVDELKGVWP